MKLQNTPSLLDALNEPIVKSVTPLNLRPYQNDAIESIFNEWQKFDRLLMVAATGTGKTVTFSNVIRKRIQETGAPCLILAHRDFLLDQAKRAIESIIPGVTVQVEGGTNVASGTPDIVVASIQSLGRSGCTRLGWFKPQTIIIDEAHHAAANGYINVLTRFGAFDAESGVKTLGVTATPHRLDNKPLHTSEKAIFEKIAFSYPIRDGIVDGYLTDIQAYTVTTNANLNNVRKTAGEFNQGDLAEAVDTRVRNLAAAKAYLSKAQGRRGIAYCVTIAHAVNFAMVANECGIPTDVITGNTPPEARAAIFNKLKSGEISLIANVEVLTEGLDIPEMSVIIMLRPTQSWALYTQCIGRGLRPSDGKSDCLIIDMTDNCSRHDLATLPAILGLPPKSTIGTSGVKSAYKTLEELPAWAKALGSSIGLDLSDVSSTLNPVNLFRSLRTPTELATETKLLWMPVADDTYELAGKERVVRVYQDTLGTWQMEYRTPKRGAVEGQLIKGPIDLGEDRKAAFTQADEFATTMLHDQMALISKTSSWRSDAVSDSQKGLLKKYGFADKDFEEMDKGQASLIIGRIFDAGLKKVAQ